MLQMLRRLSPFVVLIALLIAAEPVLHSHPLDSDLSGSSAKTACAICAAGIGRLPRVAVMTGAPQFFQDAYVCSIAPVILADVPLPRSPRAPPAA
jgi:hypothetical protein